MPLFVQKYGGTSVGNADRIKAVAERVSARVKGGDQLVVIVSAMGDTTDELIALAGQMTDEPEARELDLLLSTGEIVTSTLLSMALKHMGHTAIALSGAQAGIGTDTRYGRAQILSVDPRRIRRELDSGSVVIVAGFQGITEELDTTTLGRGGSDTTAVALAISLEAERCEILTDVDGVHIADPRIVPGARKLDEISYEEMLELASYGATVLHPRAVELGAVYKMPIYVASSFKDAPGTLIHGERDTEEADMEGRNKVMGIAQDTDVARITIRGVPDQPGIAAAIFEPHVHTIAYGPQQGARYRQTHRRDHSRARSARRHPPRQSQRHRRRHDLRPRLRRPHVPHPHRRRNQHRTHHHQRNPHHLPHRRAAGRRRRPRPPQSLRTRRSRLASLPMASGSQPPVGALLAAPRP